MVVSEKFDCVFPTVHFLRAVDSLFSSYRML